MRDRMAVYVVAQGKVTDPEKLNAYVQQAAPTVLSAGAEILAVDENPTVIEGATDIARRTRR